MPDVVVTTGVETSGVKTGLAELRSQVTGAERDITRSLDKMFAIRSLIVLGVEEGIRGAIAYGARISDLSQRFGVSTDAIQHFGNAAEKNGSSLEGVAKGFNRLEIAISKAIGGNDHLIKNFAALGITLDDLKTLSPEQIMEKLGRSSLNAADIVAILGKNALELIPTLKGIADGTIKVGLAIDSVNIKRLKDADTTFKEIYETLKIGGGVLVGYLWGKLDEFSNHAVAGFVAIKFAAIDTYKAIAAAATGNFAESQQFLAKAGGEITGAEGSVHKQHLDAFNEQSKARKLSPPTEGGTGEATIADLLGGEGSGAGSGRDQAKAEREAYLAVLDAQERIAAIEQERTDLQEKLNQGLSAGTLEDGEQESIMAAIAEKSKEIVDGQDKIAAARDRALAAAQKDLETAGDSLAVSHEETKENLLRLAGREGLVAQAKAEFDANRRIAEATKAADDADAAAKASKTEEERKAYEAVAATNRALATQLGIEKQVTDQALKKAAAEKLAADLVKVAAEATEAKATLAALQEQSAELAQLDAGHSEVAAEMHAEFEAQQRINAAQEDANDTWRRMVLAYSEGNVQLGDQLALLGKAKDAITAQVVAQEQFNAAVRASIQQEKDLAATADLGSRAIAAGITGIGQQPSIGNSIGTTAATLTEVALVTGASPEAVRIAQLQDQLQFLSGQNVTFFEQLRRDQIVQQAAEQGSALAAANTDRILAAEEQRQREELRLRSSGDVEGLRNLLGTPEFAEAHPSTANERFFAEVTGQAPTAQQKADWAILDEHDRISLDFSDKIAAANQAAADARAAGNTSAEQTNIELAAQLTQEKAIALATYDTANATSTQQAAAEAVLERKAIELDYQNQINAALAVGNQELADSLTAQKATALSIFDTAHPQPVVSPEVQSVEETLADSKERTAEIEQRIAGHDDLARKMATQYDFTKRIADATKAAADARAAGLIDLADANDALAAQLAIEEAIVLKQQEQNQEAGFTAGYFRELVQTKGSEAALEWLKNHNPLGGTAAEVPADKGTQTIVVPETLAGPAGEPQVNLAPPSAISAPVLNVPVAPPALFVLPPSGDRSIAPAMPSSLVASLRTMETYLPYLPQILSQLKLTHEKVAEPLG